MVILADTNVIIDALAKREPYAKEAQQVIEKCAKREIEGWLAAHSIPNLFYILRKEYDVPERRRLVKDLCSIFRISGLDSKKIMSAVENNEFKDFEDALQEECAVTESVDYIVTRNPSDFKTSRIPIASPEKILELLEK